MNDVVVYLQDESIVDADQQDGWGLLAVERNTLAFTTMTQTHLLYNQTSERMKDSIAAMYRKIESFYS